MQELKSLCFNTENKVSQLAEMYRQMKEECFVLKQKNKEQKDIINRLERKIKMQS